ncbi:MAG: hypothetical protein ACT4NL_15320 [Pseudomarimonas sp.]
MIIGGVVDGATDGPLVGVLIEVKQGSQTLARGITDKAGRFRLQFDAPAAAGPRAFELSASMGDYRAASTSLVIGNGLSAESVYRFRLVANAIAACIQNKKPAVVVGHFRPAAVRPDPDLSERIADALRYDLLMQIQKAEFTSANQPAIFPCKAAKPAAPDQYAGLAKLLGADVFVSGYVTSPNPVKVKVRMSVTDGYGVMPAPLDTDSPDVDLDDPQMARLAPGAHAAVLTALAIGYRLSMKPGECVDLIAASERMLGVLPEALILLRAQCKESLPNRGLL